MKPLISALSLSRLNKSNFKNNSLHVLWNLLSVLLPSSRLPLEFTSLFEVWSVDLRPGPLQHHEDLHTEGAFIPLPTPSVFLATASHGRLGLELVLYQTPGIVAGPWSDLSCVFLLCTSIFSPKVISKVYSWNLRTFKINPPPKVRVFLPVLLV